MLVGLAAWAVLTFALLLVTGHIPSTYAIANASKPAEPEAWERAAFRKEFGVAWESRHEYPMPKTRGQMLLAEDFSPDSPFAYEFASEGVPRVGVVKTVVSWKWKNSPRPIRGESAN